MRRAEIDEQNRYMLLRQRQFRMAADVVTDAFATFPEVRAVAVIGSVAKPLWKEVPRFREFHRARVEVWHECKDLDLAIWLESQHRLGTLRSTLERALRDAFEAGTGVSVAGHQVEVFLFEPESDRYLGRLCRYNRCPKDKPDCFVPGCGTIPFNKRVDGFAVHTDILAAVPHATLYVRGAGRLRSALDLPSVED
jgi:hypothetical protein